MKVKLAGVVSVFLTLSLVAVSCHKRKPVEELPVTSRPVVRDTIATKPTENPPQKRTLQESQFQTVYFDFDQYNLRMDARAGLDANYALLRDNPDVMVKIEGHCDERGTVEYNLSLGQRRAKSAQEYLVGLGISAGRISIVSYGKERPAVPGDNEEAWSRNRRCEFRILSQ